MYQKEVEPPQPFVSDVEIQNAKNLWNSWTDILKFSYLKDNIMAKTKKHFAEVTQQQVQAFMNEIKVEYNDYIKSGPGCDEISLKDGCELLDQYKEKVQELNTRKEDLVQACQLFNLQIPTFSLLAEIEESNKKLDNIY